MTDTATLEARRAALEGYLAPRRAYVLRPGKQREVFSGASIYL